MTPFLQDIEEVQNYPVIVSFKRYPNQLGMSVAMDRHLEGCAKDWRIWRPANEGLESGKLYEFLIRKCRKALAWRTLKKLDQRTID